MNYSSRFFLYAPVGAFFALVLGLAIHWYWASSQLSARLDALNGKTIMPGVTLHFAGKEMGGFPLRLDTIFTGFEISVETDHGPATWKSDGFAVHALTYGRPQQVFEAAGAQTFSWANAKGEHKTFVFIPGTLHASAIEDAGGLLRFDMDLVGMSAPAMRAAHIHFHIRLNGDGLDFNAQGDAIQFSGKLVSPFGDTVKNLRMNGRIDKGTALDALRGGKADWRAALENWRGKDGFVDVQPSTIDFGKILMNASGTLALDDARRFKGLLHLGIVGSMQSVPDFKGAEKSFSAIVLAPSLKPDGNISLLTTLAFKDGILYAGDSPVTMLDAVY